MDQSATVPKDVLNTLQQYNIDTKDFTRALSRYQVVIYRELVPPKEEVSTPEVLAATQGARDELMTAWATYLAYAQAHFKRAATKTMDDILMLDAVLNGHAERSTTAPGTPQGDAEINVTSGSGSPFSASRSQSISFSTNVPALTPLGLAERVNDMCLLLQKWFLNHESLFELPYPAELARLVGTCVRSVSRVMRLLGLQLACCAVGNITFVQALFADRDTLHWIGLCGDRLLYHEVELLFNLMDRLLDLHTVDPKAFPEIPFSWIPRVASLLTPNELLLKAPNKRKAQAMELALKLLRYCTAKATAARLHTTLLRACLVKDGATAVEMSNVIDVLIWIFSDPTTRVYIRTTDISTLFAPFLDTTTPITTEFLTTLHNAKSMLARLMCTWVGNLWIGCESVSLRALIDVLYLPGNLDHKMVIFNLLNLVLLRLAPHRGIAEIEPWMGVDEDRRRKEQPATPTTNPSELRDSTLIGSLRKSYSNVALADTLLDNANGNRVSAEGADDTEMEEYIPTTRALGFHLMEPLLGRVLINLVYHGLPLALIGLLREPNNSSIVLEATSELLQNLFVLMDTVLPRDTVGSLHHTLNRTVGHLSNDGDLFVGGLTSQLFHSFKKTKTDLNAAAVEAAIAPAANAQMSVTFGSAGGAIDLDEPTFLAMLRETRVNTSPLDFKAWNFEVLLLLIQGPWRNLRRLRASASLIKMLLGFYTPRQATTAFYMKPFCSLNRETATSQMCLVGIELVDLLLTSREGAEMLDAAGFPDAIVLMLREVRLGTPTILNKATVPSRVGQSLLRMVGIFTAYANGLTLMRDRGVFDSINELFSKLSGARLEPSPTDTLQDVCYQLVQYVYVGAVPNYGICEDVRYTLRQAINSGSSSLRLCVVMQLRKSLWRDLSSSMKWGVETLVQALHDDFYSVVECAFRLLLSVCLCSEDGLDYLISLVPNVLMESEVILSHAKQLGLSALLYLITSRPAGFRFLQCYGWIEKELARWDKKEHANFTAALYRLQNNTSLSDASATNAMEGSLSAVLGGNSFRSSMSLSHRPSRSLTESRITGKANHAQTPITFTPVTASALSTANFFPVHFASVLCSSPEGCALFKHSNLWQRSLALINEQQLPPDIAYEDSLSDDDEGSEKSDDDYNVAVGLTAKERRRNLLESRDEDVISTRQLHQLKKGDLRTLKSAAEANFSAARGYQTSVSSFVLTCTGDRWALQQALLVIAEAGSTEVGFGLVSSQPDMLTRLTAIARFASDLDLRAMALLSSSLHCRSRRGMKAYRAAGFSVICNPNAYVSADGVPYAVAFAHMRLTKIMSISKRYATTNTAVRHALAGAQLDFDTSHSTTISRRLQRTIVDSLRALANPVSKEASKKTLYNLMKRKPETFVEPRIVKFALEVVSCLRLAVDERKFVADLLENAQMLPPSTEVSKPVPRA